MSRQLPEGTLVEFNNKTIYNGSLGEIKRSIYRDNYTITLLKIKRYGRCLESRREFNVSYSRSAFRLYKGNHPFYNRNGANED